MKIFAVLVATVVVMLTLIANLGYANQVFGFLKYVPGRDITGHFVLYGVLGFAATAGIARSRWATIPKARAIMTTVLATLITLEEFSQALIATRTFSFLDLSASLAGVLLGSAASTWIMTVKSNRADAIHIEPTDE